MNIRNIAIIAHVDHGKTTLVDQLLRQSGLFRNNEMIEQRVMDNNDIEKERGITILAKTTAIDYKDYRINILDTPGHADFGGEVERIMNMVDGVLLVVDAYEGTMPQTRFVLKKALEANVKPIVVINKVDRPNARIIEVLDEVFDLFVELQATDEQLDFQVVYASGLKGTSSLEMEVESQETSMDAIFDTIISTIPSPKVIPNGHLRFQPALLDYNDYVGRIGIGLLREGSVSVNQMVSCVRLDGTTKSFRVQKIFGFYGLHKIELESAEAGQIIALSGLSDISVGETVCEPGFENPLPHIHIDEPTLKMTFGTNTSPLSGQEGKFVTARQIEDYLFKETQKDVSLLVERVANSESWIVSGRGELHLSILIENMRRLGFELQVSKPQVILKTIDGVVCEPYESVQIDAPEETIGSVIEQLGARRGIMEDMNTFGNQTRIHYVIPSRGLIGFSSDFMTQTKGYGMISHTFLDYRPYNKDELGKRNRGALISMENGKSTMYGIGQLEDRGVLFVSPGTEVYEGMIVGENNRENDLTVNVVRSKQMTNMRSASKDNTVVLKKNREMTLELSLDYIADDELVEVTPLNIRIRKKFLTENERKRSNKVVTE